MSPFSLAATATAQAPVPHAKVIPDPRSQTRIFISEPSIMLTISKLTLFGKIGWFSIWGPISVKGNSSTGSSIKHMACGFPMDTNDISRL